MAKRKRKNEPGRRRRKAGHNPLARRHHRRGSRNPLLAGESMTNSVKLVGSAAAGLLGDVYIPAWLLSLMGRPDAGVWSYIVAALAVILPTWIFAKVNWPNVAKGWLAGAGAGFIWRAIDDATGQKYVTIQSGMGSFLVPSQVALPGPNVFGQYARKALPAATATAAVVSTPVGKGMGYIKYPYAA